MKTRSAVALSLVALLALLAGCSKKTPEKAEAAFEPVRAHIVPVERLSRQEQIEVYGLVQPGRQSFLSGRVVGPVVAVKVDAGQRVAKGDELVVIQPQAIEGQVAQARGALAQAEAAFAMAEKNFLRFERLHEKKAASDVELDMARMHYEQAQGAVQQARGAVEAARAVAQDAVIRAPFDARVVDTLVEVGDLAAPGRPLVRVESLSGSQLWLSVRESDIARIQLGDRLPVAFDSRADLGKVEGVVDEILPAADPATHTFTVKIGLEGLAVPSGISGRAWLPGPVSDALVLDQAAVHRRGGLELVVVRDEEGRARTRAVTTGARVDGQRVEILSGLGEGMQVVLDAPGPLADGTPVEVLR
ncbi:MAG: efflux RND transporter periplasmic adaptor subunit [Acidobacteriota bacterium]|nr:efflux RND transporter periplasmic adaptor subunit [Acidobacteriota bacterium]MDQ7088115.1 efflux RND transporter periplasmic adaptor subunit [Acidobacteriota bacterium]